MDEAARRAALERVRRFNDGVAGRPGGMSLDERQEYASLSEPVPGTGKPKVRRLWRFCDMVPKPTFDVRDYYCRAEDVPAKMPAPDAVACPCREAPFTVVEHVEHRKLCPAWLRANKGAAAARAAERLLEVRAARAALNTPPARKPRRTPKMVETKEETRAAPGPAEDGGGGGGDRVPAGPGAGEPAAPEGARDALPDGGGGPAAAPDGARDAEARGPGPGEARGEGDPGAGREAAAPDADGPPAGGSPGAGRGSLPPVRGVARGTTRQNWIRLRAPAACPECGVAVRKGEEHPRCRVSLPRFVRGEPACRFCGSLDVRPGYGPKTCPTCKAAGRTVPRTLRPLPARDEYAGLVAGAQPPALCSDPVAAIDELRAASGRPRPSPLARPSPGDALPVPSDEAIREALAKGAAQKALAEGRRIGRNLVEVGGLLGGSAWKACVRCGKVTAPRDSDLCCYCRTGTDGHHWLPTGWFPEGDDGWFWALTERRERVVALVLSVPSARGEKVARFVDLGDGEPPRSERVWAGRFWSAPVTAPPLPEEITPGDAAPEEEP